MIARFFRTRTKEEKNEINIPEMDLSYAKNREEIRYGRNENRGTRRLNSGGNSRECALSIDVYTLDWSRYKKEIHLSIQGEGLERWKGRLPRLPGNVSRLSLAPSLELRIGYVILHSFADREWYRDHFSLLRDKCFAKYFLIQTWKDVR